MLEYSLARRVIMPQSNQVDIVIGMQEKCVSPEVGRAASGPLYLQ